MSDLVTTELLKNSIPSRKGTITDEIADIINKYADEPEFQGESLLQSMTTYESVMVKHRVGIKDYLNAIRFCAYLISQDDNYTEAYKRTFTEKEFVRTRLSAPTNSNAYNELTSAASRYRRSKLVTEILTLSQVPLDLLFTGARYKALGVLIDIASNAKLDRDRVNAADKLLVHTASKDIKIELDIGVKENSAVQQLNDQLAAMAVRQKELMSGGVKSLKDFGALKPKEDYIDADFKELGNE
jgi:hypothetical protein